MTNKELRRLNRKELLEMLIEQGKELEMVRQELETANAKLERREIALAECGSIAEASLKLSGIFEAAQAAADQYLESLKAANANRGQAKAAAEEILRGAEAERRALLEKTRQECAAMVAKAKEECRHVQYDALRKEMK